MPGHIEAIKPRLAAKNVFLMAARGSPNGEQAAYLTCVLATLPEPTRVLFEVSLLVCRMYAFVIYSTEHGACLMI